MDNIIKLNNIRLLRQVVTANPGLDLITIMDDNIEDDNLDWKVSSEIGETKVDNMLTDEDGNIYFESNQEHMELLFEKVLEIIGDKDFESNPHFEAESYIDKMSWKKVVVTRIKRKGEM